jgi:hypothetical protein
VGAAQRQRRTATKRPPAAPAAEQLAALRRKYGDLWSKHRTLVRRANRSAAEHAGMLALGLFALRASDAGLAIAAPEHVLFRNGRWNALEHDRTSWRAIARDPVAAAAAPTLLHLATTAARALLARGAPAAAAARYGRPDRDDVFDVRFERLAGLATIGVSVRDVTHLVDVERERARTRRSLEPSGEDPPAT